MFNIHDLPGKDNVAEVKQFWVTLIKGASLSFAGRKWVKNKPHAVSDSDPTFKRYEMDARFAVTEVGVNARTDLDARKLIPRRKRPSDKVRESIFPPPGAPVVDESGDDGVDDEPVGPPVAAIPGGLAPEVFELAKVTIDVAKATRQELDAIAIRIGARGPEGEHPATAKTKGILGKWIRDRQTAIAGQLPKVVGP